MCQHLSFLVHFECLLEVLDEMKKCGDELEVLIDFCYFIAFICR